MATVAHHIYSYYSPEDREKLEIETGQPVASAESDVPAEVEQPDPWVMEKPFGVSVRVANPPRFVAATVGYDQWGSLGEPSGSQDHLRPEEDTDNGRGGLGGWYRGLARKTSSGTPRNSTSVAKPSAQQDEGRPMKKQIKKDRNSWFISRILESAGSNTNAFSASDPPSSSNLPSPAPQTTLADILARDPPPLPTEEQYSPPVWLSIGPSNRGFAMLQKSGWEEGEALGRASRSRAGLGYSGDGKGKIKATETDVDFCGSTELVKQEVIDISFVDDEVIDLTALDSDTEIDIPTPIPTKPKLSPQIKPQPPPPVTSIQSDLDHSPRALLTPLPTILKTDRLGIGLKAKTTGSGIYRAPVKRVTHSQAAVAAHVRAGEALRRRQMEVGRGRRGFEKLRKRNEEGRRNLLAYLNG